MRLGVAEEGQRKESNSKQEGKKSGREVETNWFQMDQK